MPRDKTAEAEKMPIALAWGKRNRNRLQRKLQDVCPAQSVRANSHPQSASWLFAYAWHTLS